MRRSLYRSLPNALTISRSVLGLIVLYCGIRHAWAAGFWIFILALLTDFLDGLAAKKLHAKTRLGAMLDPLADFLLSACGMLGLYAAHKIPLWAIILMGLSAAGIGYVKFLRTDRPRWQRITQVFSVAYLFVIWTAIAIAYASFAFGWSWLYILAAGLLIGGAATLKRHRLRAWYGWLMR